MNRDLTAPLRPVWARVVRAFFANFFRILLLGVSISQWVILGRLWPAIGHLPVPAQLAGPVLIYALNRRLALRTQRQRRDRAPVGGMPRLYYAIAFTCLFCVLVLLFTDALWVTAKVMLGTLTAHARTVHHSHVRIDSELDTAFRWLANAGMASISLAFAYGYSIGQMRLRVRQFTLPLRHCPPGWNGLRIVQISDIHIGQNIDRIQLARFVQRANDLHPDILCITGDIADSPSADLENFLPVLAGLRARHGVYAILGNHDHYAGADEVEAALRRLTGFTVLRDEHTTVEVNGHRLRVIGLDDYGRDWARGERLVPYLDAAVAAAPADEPILLLSHRPDVFPQAADHGVALTLAGHTHGGQIGVPWFDGRIRNLAEFMTEFDRGLFERKGSYLYVNCGLGVTGQRIRLNTPREILVIEVQSAVKLAA
jgi:predicted MPP superfamily phosphohydrolase